MNLIKLSYRFLAIPTPNSRLSFQITWVKCPVFNVAGSLPNTWFTPSLYQCSAGSQPSTVTAAFELQEQNMFSPYGELSRCAGVPRAAMTFAHSSANLHNFLFSRMVGTPCLTRNSLCALRHSLSNSLWLDTVFRRTGDWDLWRNPFLTGVLARLPLCNGWADWNWCSWTVLEWCVDVADETGRDWLVVRIGEAALPERWSSLVDRLSDWMPLWTDEPRIKRWALGDFWISVSFRSCFSVKTTVRSGRMPLNVCIVSKVTNSQWGSYIMFK